VGLQPPESGEAIFRAVAKFFRQQLTAKMKKIIFLVVFIKRKDSQI